MRQEKTLGKKQWKYAEARTRRPTLPLLLFCLLLLHNGVKNFLNLMSFQHSKKLTFYQLYHMEAKYSRLYWRESMGLFKKLVVNVQGTGWTVNHAVFSWDHALFS